MTILQLTDADAKLFLLFRKHQDVFGVMVQAGVFNVRSGEAILSFKPTGELGSIVLKSLTYRS